MLLQEHRQYEDFLSSCDICGQLFPNEDCMICHIRNTHNDIEDLLEEESNCPKDSGAIPPFEETPSNLRLVRYAAL